MFFKLKILLYLPLTLFFIANLFYCPLPARAIDDSMPNLDINKLQVKIPTLTKFTQPTECGAADAQGNKKFCISWIGEYIAAIYKYAIGIVGILAAVVLMIGGVIWIVAGGSATMIGEAKAWIGASLTGLVIALCSYLILYQINPALTVFGPLGIAQVKKTEVPVAVSTAGCSWEIAVTGGACTSGVKSDDEKCTSGKPDSESNYICCCKKFGGNCQSVTTGSCSVANLGIFGDKAEQASAICQGESNGAPGVGSGTDICADGNVASWGLFQINITAHSVGGYNCPNAFSGGAYTASKKSCRVVDATLYNNCVNAAKNPNTNIQKAYEIYSSGGWGQWDFYAKACKSYF